MLQFLQWSEINYITIASADADVARAHGTSK